MESTWDRLEQPLLEAIAQAEAAGRAGELLGQLAQEAGLDLTEAQNASRALYESDYIGGEVATTFESGFLLIDPYLKERGRRAVGVWPSDDAYANFVQVLETAVAAEADASRKSKLATLLSAVKDVGVDIAGTVLSAFATRAAGLG